MRELFMRGELSELIIVKFKTEGRPANWSYWFDSNFKTLYLICGIPKTTAILFKSFSKPVKGQSEHWGLCPDIRAVVFFIDCSKFRYESNGIFVLGVGFFFGQIATF